MEQANVHWKFHENNSVRSKIITAHAHSHKHEGSTGIHKLIFLRKFDKRKIVKQQTKKTLNSRAATHNIK
jgi:hypothetical protein